jgi:hypothetical protein
MIEKTLNTESLIPTNDVRNPKTILDIIPLYVHGGYEKIPPIHVISYNFSENEKYLICSGNHRAVSAYICKKPIKCKILTEKEDLSEVLEGFAGKCETLKELHDNCEISAKEYHYLDKGWDEFLRDMFFQNIEPNF